LTDSHIKKNISFVGQTYVNRLSQPIFSPVQIKYVDKEKEEENAILDQGAHI
jgi:hypothetical protein